MPLVHRLLVTLRTLLEDEPEPSRNRKRRPNVGNKNGNRNRQTTALILTFRDLFRSGGLNILLDEVEMNRRYSRKNSRSYSSCYSNNTACKTAPETALCAATNQPGSDMSVVLKDQNATILPLAKPVCQEEILPLLQEDPATELCTDLVPSPVPMFPGGLFSGLAISRKKTKKSKNLTVPLNPDDENKTVETLKKALKWSPRKQNSVKFAVSLPIEEKHTALAVVENAVNRVKEEQLCKKKRKFLWLKIC